MTREELLLEQWKMASELHRHMENLAWQGLSIFIATNGGLMAVLGALVISDRFLQKDLVSYGVSGAICVTGMLLSSIWGLLQMRQQLYMYYRVAQAKQAEEALTIDSERTLTLYEKNLNEQDILSFPLLERYRKSPIGKWHAHSLVTVLSFLVATVWGLLFLILVVYAVIS